MPSTTTIRDVALKAGVSVGTASHVLHGKSHLHAPATVKRVIDAAAALDYRANRVARNLVKRNTQTIGVVSDPFHGRPTMNEYLGGILDGLVAGSAARDYQIKLLTLGRTDLDYAVPVIEDGSVDGLALIAPRNDSPLVSWAMETSLPVVVVGSVPPGARLASVDVDDESSVHEAVTWLLSLGHRRIGIITGPVHQWSAQRRLAGYQAALRRASIDPLPEWTAQGDYTWVSGFTGIRSLTRTNPRVTAVVCANDGVALAAMRALEQMGLCVPEDISIIGFDDVHAAQWSQPQLSTIRQPLHEIGVDAAETLVRQVQTGQRVNAVRLFPGTLVKRGSVAPPRRASLVT